MVRNDGQAIKKLRPCHTEENIQKLSLLLIHDSDQHQYHYAGARKHSADERHAVEDGRRLHQRQHASGQPARGSMGPG